MTSSPSASGPPPRPFLSGATLLAADARFLDAFARTVSRIPPEVLPLRSVGSIELARGAETSGMVGLTRMSIPQEAEASPGVQTITFYADLLDQLSEKARMAVIVHELAHAWLNEHVGPEQSRRREGETDELARSWGFGEELDELDREAESI